MKPPAGTRCRAHHEAGTRMNDRDTPTELEELTERYVEFQMFNIAPLFSVVGRRP